MKRDSAVTRKYIDDAYRRFLLYHDPVARNQRAFAYLRGRRRRGDEPLLRQLGIGSVPDDAGAPFDVNLADAEHYMYARFLASLTGDPSVRALVAGYEVKKFLASVGGSEQEMRTNSKYPVLPASFDSIRWGLRGADDGFNEYKVAHDGRSGKLGSALETNRDFIAGQYKSGYDPKRAVSY